MLRVFSQLLLVIGLASPLMAYAQPVITIDGFASSAIGQYPKGWRTWPTQGSKAREVYKVAAEGENQYLAASDTQNHSVQIFREFGWDTATHPVIAWRWRARTLPKGANERSPAANDSACGVYVIFSKVAGKGLKYVWSSTLPPGATHTKEAGKMYFSVLDSGGGPSTLRQVQDTASAGQAWRSHRVNVVADYTKFFGQAPEKPPVGILTDGNATQSASACDYDDFTIARESRRETRD